jgi:predicted Zn finger-like uncharacterized protein
VVLHLRSQGRLSLYTQCSKCETIFKLSPEVLRAAGGQVRCGKCGEVFNALARLAEDSSGFATGESPLDLEARADRILESVDVPQVARAVAEDDEEDLAPPGIEIAHLEVLDWFDGDQADGRGDEPRDPTPQTADEPSLEFTLPPGELDRIFVESKPVAPQRTPHAAPPLDAAAEPEPEAPRISGLEVPEEVRREMLAGFEQDVQHASVVQDLAPRSQGRRGFMLWLGGAIFAALLLLGQIVQQNREGFLARALYGALGARLPAPANLSVYQLRQWGVTGDPEANGKLRLRASILNTAAQLQPYPLLRVTLADRFGKSIGTRDFEPSEYLGKPTARLLAPGERADANLEILDPGKNAEGFEIDVCMRGIDQRVVCANDAAAQAKR